MSTEPKEPQDVANEYLRQHHISELFEVAFSQSPRLNSNRIYVLLSVSNNQMMLNSLLSSNSS